MYKLGQSVQPFDKYFTSSCHVSGPVLSSLEYQTKMLGFGPRKDYLLQGTKGSKQIIRKAIWPCHNGHRQNREVKL